MALTQLAKATIVNMDTNQTIFVMYNPAELKLVGTLAAEEVSLVTDGLFSMDVPVEINRKVFEYDQVIIDLRRMLTEGMEDVQAGRDPKHIIRDIEDNDIVYVRGDAAMELV